MDALEVAQHVEMRRRGLQRLRPALAQPLEMTLGRRQLRSAQLHLVRDQLARLVEVAGHEYADRHPEAVENALVERLELVGALGRELQVALDLLDRELPQVLVDDVAGMLEVDRERDDLHGTSAFAVA